MLSKIDVLKNEPSSYSWKAERLIPTREYEWEKRAVVKVEPPSGDEPVDNPIDFDEELKTYEYYGLPAKQIETGYLYVYKYKNADYWTYTYDKDKLSYWDIYYHLTLPPYNLKTISDDVRDVNNWEYINETTFTPFTCDIEMTFTENATFGEIVYYSGIDAVNQKFYPELIFVDNKSNLFKNLLALWVNSEWSVTNQYGQRVFSTYETDSGTKKIYTHYRVLKPRLLNTGYDFENVSLKFKENDVFKPNIPSIIKSGYSGVKDVYKFDSVDWKNYFNGWKKKHPNYKFTSWSDLHVINWDSTQEELGGSWDVYCLNYGPLVIGDGVFYVNKNIDNMNRDSIKPTPEQSKEVTYEKGALIEKLYSTNPNEYPLDKMDANKEYWYTRVSSQIVSFTFTKQYTTITNKSEKAYPYKGTSTYNGQYYWFTYLGANRSVLISFESNVLLDNIDYIQSTGSSKSFTIGNVAGASIEFSVWKPLLEVLPYAGMECIYYQRYNDSEDWIQEGIFTIREVRENGLKKSTIIAYDNTNKLESDARVFVENLYYPTSLYQLFIMICAYCDIPYDLETYFPNMDIPIWEKIEFENDTQEISCRDLLTWIAEIAGGLFLADVDGKIVFKDMAQPTKLKGSNERTNYKLDISKLPILKPTKVKYKDISVSDTANVYWQEINVADFTKNPILAVWDDKTIKSILNSVLLSIKNIGLIYPMECHIDNDRAQRQCGDNWLIISDNASHPSMITEKHIDSSGVTLKCSGDIIPYLIDYELTDDDIVEIIKRYEDTFFRFYYNSIEIQDVSGYPLATIDDNGYIDEYNLKLEIKNVEFSDDPGVVRNYSIDFSSCINELLIKDGVHVKTGNGLYVSFIDDKLVIQDTRYWRKDISSVKFKYYLNDSSFIYNWNHAQNTNVSIDENMYFLQILNVYTNNEGINDTKQYMYAIASLFKTTGATHVVSEKLSETYNSTLWRLKFPDNQIITISTRNKYPSLLFVNGINIDYDNSTNTIYFHVLAAVKEIDSDHTGDYVQIKFVETDVYYIHKSPAWGLDSVAPRTPLQLVNTRGERITKLYNGEIAYALLEEGYAITIQFNKGFYNNLGILLTYKGIGVSFYGEKLSNEPTITIDLFNTGLSRNLQTVETKGSSLLYRCWVRGDGANVVNQDSQYYKIALPLMDTSRYLIIEYIDDNNDSYFYNPCGGTAVDNGRLRPAYYIPKYSLDEHTTAQMYVMDDSKLSLKMAFIQKDNVDLYSVTDKAFDILLDNDDYEITAINGSLYNRVEAPSNAYTSDKYYDLERISSQIYKVYISGGSREQAIRLMLTNGGGRWYQRIQDIGHWGIPNFYEDGKPITLYSLSTFDYVQIRKKGQLPL